MKLMFTADLHIKLGQKNVPVDWARRRYEELFVQLGDYYQSVDLLVVGGDIFDKLPSMEELALFFEFVSGIGIPCYMYSGNHEALKKNTTFLTYLKSTVRKLNKNVTILDDFHSEDNIDFIPYNKLKEYHPADIDFHGNILCTHVRGEIPPHVKPEVPLELFERWDVVLAGDLHSYENSQLNILYPGSPVTTSFHRNKVDTGFIILNTDTLKHEWIKLELPQLIRKTIKAGEPMIAGTVDHIVYEVEGDMSELADVENSELLDKKVIKREVDTALMLTPSMSMNDEVEEYLRYILQLKDETVKEVLLEFNNYVS